MTTSDFIDRAKLEALAEEHSKQDANWHARELARAAFLAGAAAYAALLDAETTEEWGVVFMADDPSRVSQEDGLVPHTEESARAKAARMPRTYEAAVVSRRVTPWLPSEGGEKP
ncbi:hypothetical protein [Pseudoclavibacter helvolus]|uniref:hypothetical protein n=1 Tax=Pseudoclavibacter helvolus TaxID=255205 RepID=UPI003C7550C1